MYLDYTYEDPQICFQKIFQSRTKKLGVEFEIDSSNINDKGLKLIFKKEKYEEEQNIIVDYILLARIIYNITRGYEKDFYYKTYFGSYIFFIGIAISLQYLLLGVLIALLGIAIIMYAILIGIGKYSDIFEYAKLTLGI